METYGAKFNKPAGYIAAIGEDSYLHRFGGQSWLVIDEHPIAAGPTLLLTLDLSDDRLASLRINGLSELPLVSYVNGTDLWLQPQLYTIYASAKQVRLDKRASQKEAIDPTFVIKTPLPEHRLALREMATNEYPITEDAFYDACDEFVGGSSFIRILGPPLWLQEPLSIRCSCNEEMCYIAGIGYERYDKPSGYLDNEPFFLGEMALYFHLCKKCLKLRVSIQST